MRRPLIVLGSSGLAREVAMVAEHINAREHRWEFRGFIGASTAERGLDLGLGPVLGDDDWLLSQDLEADLLIAVGYPKVRAKILQKYLAHGDRFGYPNLIHPMASLDFRRVELGRGNVVTAGVAMTCDIQVGDFNHLNLNCTVGHDAVIGSYNVVNPGVCISGNVKMGDRILVGTGCQVLENLTIGSDAVLGAGSLVRADVAPGQTIIGVPGKALPPRS